MSVCCFGTGLTFQGWTKQCVALLGVPELLLPSCCLWELSRNLSQFLSPGGCTLEVCKLVCSLAWVSGWLWKVDIYNCRDLGPDHVLSSVCLPVLSGSVTLILLSPSDGSGRSALLWSNATSLQLPLTVLGMVSIPPVPPTAEVWGTSKPQSCADK